MAKDPSIVSKNMSRIHSKDTSIEVQLRKALWHKGYRYRKNFEALPGSPDIVLTKYKIAIFCETVPAIGRTIKNFYFSATLLFISGVVILSNTQKNVCKPLKKLSGIANCLMPNEPTDYYE